MDSLVNVTTTTAHCLAGIASDLNELACVSWSMGMNFACHAHMANHMASHMASHMANHMAFSHAVLPWCKHMACHVTTCETRVILPCEIIIWHFHTLLPYIHTALPCDYSIVMKIEWFCHDVYVRSACRDPWQIGSREWFTSQFVMGPGRRQLNIMYSSAGTHDNLAPEHHSRANMSWVPYVCIYVCSGMKEWRRNINPFFIYCSIDDVLYDKYTWQKK